ncbi:MAG: RNA-guided pseudouridylation complex pseudouridine synthase subunit Cbf5 [Methanobacteriota archaeon]
MTGIAPRGPRLVRSKASTAREHGRLPAERPIREHLRFGVVNLDKPAGPTSHQVASWVKKLLGISRAGHGGTLDPNVTGVLPVALEDATRGVKTLLEAPKEYVCVLRLHGAVPRKEVEAALAEFTGEIWQMPPLKSAVKRQLRKRRIYEIELLEIEDKDVLFRVACEAGTYIRKLCHDLGLVLGVGGNMRELRRVRTAAFSEATSVTLHDLIDAYAFWKEEGDESELRRVVRPMEELLAHLPKVVARDTAVDAVCHGADLAVPGVAEVDPGVKPGDLVGILSLKGEAVAIGRAKMTSEDVVAKPEGVAVDTWRVMMDPGTYPKGWKTA